MPHPVLLDVDTGIDDAMAIMFAVAHPDVDVRAITCVSGNVALDRVVGNTLRVLDLVGAPPIPVAAGAVRPLIEPARDASLIHGADGLADLPLPPSARPVESVHAVELLRREILASTQPVTIVALAPLTNIALLLRTHPEVGPRIGRILFMGGSASGGNATAVAEFNVWHDPEAAAIVVDSAREHDIDVAMYGLDVFNRVAVGGERVDALRVADREIERALGGLLGHEMTDPSDGSGYTLSLIGDAGAVCALVAPELFRFERRSVRVELAPGAARGQTIVDRRAHAAEDAQHGEGPDGWPLVDVALDVDVDAVVGLFFDTVLRA